MKRTGKAKYALAAIVALVTFIVYLPTLENGFIDSWDDNCYVLENPSIRSFGRPLFSWAFLGFHAANWHPLTWISHALDYAVWGLNPIGHHLTSIILHAVNTFLIVLVTVALFESAEKRSGTAHVPRVLFTTGAVTGLLFGLHPIHVESVAWVAERKDLLCGMFFILSIMTYIKSVQGRALSPCTMHHAAFIDKHYLLSIVFFLLALLSKPMAVTLPLVLLILDYAYDRMGRGRIFRVALVEKAPFILVALLSSVLTLLAQNARGALSPVELTPLSIRALVAGMAVVMYLVKIIAPFNLLPFYPYPKESDASALFFLKYISAFVLVLAITGVCLLLIKKRKLPPALWGYYLVTLLPVLGIIQAGGQSMADRYMYLPSIGPFLGAGLAAGWIAGRITSLKNLRLLKMTSLFVVLFAFAGLSYLTVKQIGIWKDGVSLWSAVLEKEPVRVPFAYYLRGLGYHEQGRIDKAIHDYNSAIALNPDDRKALNQRARAYYQTGRSDLAIDDYRQIIFLDPSSWNAYSDLGIVYGARGAFDKAIEYFTLSLELNPGNPDSYAHRGTAYELTGDYERALLDFNTSLQMKSDSGAVYYKRGEVFMKTGKKDRALLDFQQACKLGSAEGCRVLQR